jgi:GNAT superfamily N-acetyltransferase
MPADPPVLAALAATWPAAETARCGSWTLRRGAGGGNRVSAATLDGAFDGPFGGPLAELDAAEAATRAWGQAPLFQVRHGEAALDTVLDARGYARRDPTLLLAVPAAVLATDGPDERVVHCSGPLAAMVGLWVAGGIGPARLAVMARAPAPRCWLLGRLGDRVAGCGFVAVHREVAMLHALEVAPEARRQGLGAGMTRAAAAWGLRHGAATLAVAVTEANQGGRALYGALGLAEAGGYHYRALPA